mgnify:CR=1 FL=1
MATQAQINAAINQFRASPGFKMTAYGKLTAAQLAQAVNDATTGRTTDTKLLSAINGFLPSGVSTIQSVAQQQQAAQVAAANAAAAAANAAAQKAAADKAAAAKAAADKIAADKAAADKAAAAAAASPELGECAGRPAALSSATVEAPARAARCTSLQLPEGDSISERSNSP